jgi:TRAP-type C4-dicarboxylate transport system permease small subunit
MRLLESIDRALARLEGWLIVLFVWVMIVFTFAQVCLRALYTHAHAQWANLWMGHLDWSEPMVRLLVLWVAFLGASLLTGENKHIKIDVFSAILPQRWLPLRELILSVAAVLISAVMVKVCAGYVKLEMTFGGTLFLGLPNWVGELILPLGFATILFRFTVRAVLRVLELAEGTGS